MSRITLPVLADKKSRREKITCLTCYDAAFASIMDRVGVEIMLIGDSLGMVVQGKQSTITVTLADMIYHSRLVAQSAQNSLILTDMPFMTYATPVQALENATQLIQEGLAQVVKLEGGRWLAETFDFLNQRGIPVCGHLGLQPQSILKMGTYKFQGRTHNSAQQIVDDAILLEQAGAVLLVLECVPRQLAKLISERLTIPVIGIGAGGDCDGQVLVSYDILGISGQNPRHSHNFLASAMSIEDAIKGYVIAVKTGNFPSLEHGID